MISKVTKIYFPVLVLLLCILRLITLDLQPLSLDELTTINLISTNKGLAFVLNWIKINDTQLPLYYIFEYITYHFVGKSIFILRLPSLIFTLLGIYTSYQFTKNVKDKETGQFVTLFLLSSFIITFHSQEVRPYGLLFFLSTLSFSLSSQKNRHLHYYFTLVLLSLTHYYGLALALIHLIIKLSKIRSKRDIKKIIFILIPCCLLALILGKDIYIDLLVVHPFREAVSLKGLINIITYMLGGKFTVISLVIFIFYNFFKLKKKPNLTNLYLPCLALILIAIFKSLLTTPILEARYFIGLMLPITFILSQYIVNRYLWTLVILLSFYNTYYHENITKKPYRLATQEVSDYINRKHTTSDFITSCDINLKYYIPHFSDCNHRVCEVPEDVIYITMNNNQNNCLTFNNISKSHVVTEKKIFKGLEVHYYKKK
jgi:hypothetical protein